MQTKLYWPRLNTLTLLTLLTLVVSLFNHTTQASENQSTDAISTQTIQQFCSEWSKKLRTVKYKGCLNLGLEAGDIKSVEGRLITQRRFKPAKQYNHLPIGRIMFISGVHGDEYTAISLTYLWLQNMIKHKEKTRQDWLFFPLANPDGLMRSPATRVNANDVDVNRNFPSPDWDELAIKYWERHRNKRRYPGTQANSEPETQLIVEAIEEFKPDAIISLHAPYGLLDYDGPDHAIPNRIGALKHRELGTYPGSLGRYAGEYLNIPVLTLELRSAGSMPSQKEIYKMWRDVEKWTEDKIQGTKIAERQKMLSSMNIIETQAIEN